MRTGFYRRKLLPKQMWLPKLWVSLTLISSGSWLPTIAAATIYDRSGNKIPDREVNSEAVAWELLPTQRQYNGIGRVRVGLGGGCTGFFIKTGNNPAAPAYILTNGHCLDSGFPQPDEVVVDRPSNSAITFNYFHDRRVAPVEVPVKRVVYGTMRGTDFAILELKASYRDLTAKGIQPWRLASVFPAVGTPIEVVGVPQEGRSIAYLHRTTCRLGITVNVREMEYRFERSFRNQCSLVGGMSGSPVIDTRNRTVIGIANTGGDDRTGILPPCSLNRPCEVTGNNLPIVRNEYNYGQPLTKIPTCFTPSGRVNVRQRSCQLRID